MQTAGLLAISLDESGNWNASGKQVAEFENNVGFAGLGSVESLRFFLQRLSMVSFRAHLSSA